MAIKSYQDLIVWKKSMDLAIEIFQITKKFPREEIFGLAAQMRKAAFSIPSNIAEGYCRHTKSEYIQFLRIAYASGAELETQLIIAQKTKLLDDSEFQQLYDLLGEVMRMLNVLISTMRSSRPNP